MRNKYPVGLYILAGRRGTGKTTLIRSLIGEFLADGRQLVLVHDTRAQIPGQIWRSVEDFKKSPKWQNKVNVFPTSSVADVAALAVQLGERRMRIVLVIDELDLACKGSMRFVDDRADKPGALRTIVHYGRHIGRPPGSDGKNYGLDLIGSCRRPTNLCTDLGELAERIYLFASNGRNTINWISETCGEDVANKVAHLPLYQHIVYDPADTSDLQPA